MAKRFLEDMVKIKRESRASKTEEMSLQPKLTPPVEPKVKEVKEPKAVKAELFEPLERRMLRLDEKERSRGPRYAIWTVAVLSVVFLFFSASYLFSKATVTVSPKVQSVTLNENLSANKDSSGSDLPFDLVVISGEETKMVEAKTERDASIPARGTVILYNNFSPATQGLDIDTRLEGSNGKIYKTTKRVVIPGKSGNTPGSVEVDIYASSAGAEYNSSPLDFKIFGFKGTPKYSKFYARSKGEIVGGFKGMSAVVSDEDKLKAETELKDALQSKLQKNAQEQIPRGILLFPGAMHLEVEAPEVPIAATNNMLSIKERGTLYGILLDEKKLTKKIAQDTIKNFDGSDVYIPSITDLKFTLSAQPSSPSGSQLSFADVKNISFNISGPAKVVWRFDQDKLLADLLGRSKSDFSQILSEYSNIDSALLKLSPPWIRSIPSKSKAVHIIVNYPE